MLMLTIAPIHSRYVVTDSKNRTLYTIKKKWHGGYLIIDSSGYELYQLSEGSEERHPVYKILLNDKPVAELRCRSRFLEPLLELEANGTVIRLRTDDHLHYAMQTAGADCGSLTIQRLPHGEFRFDLAIEDALFDDYLPLIPLAAIQCIAPQPPPTK